MYKKLFIIFILIIVGVGFFSLKVHAQDQEENICVVYFSGIGCPRCAKTDPVITAELPEKYPYFVVIKYEIFQQTSNAPLISQYNDVYGSGLGVPLLIFSKNKYLIGDRDILQNSELFIKDLESNPCPLPDGTSVEFHNLNIARVAGSPKIIVHDSVLDKITQERPGKDIEFTLAKILSLAAVDAINPCALAVLLLMLMTIVAYHPKNKQKILFAGLSFVVAVFVMYLIYGLIIVRFFQLVQAIASVRLWAYKVLGVFALILGILNIKDFIFYKPGGIATEMPMGLRPKVKKLLTGVTSVKGAFIAGLFVTLFLLPCTIGPYVIAGGILSAFALLKTVPLLILYNIIFVLPMIVITAIVYFGIARAETVSYWKDKHIRYLHLITGLIIFLLGLVMVFGLI